MNITILFDNNTDLISCIATINSLIENKKFYIGQTTNPVERFLQHKQEKNISKMYLLSRIYEHEDNVSIACEIEEELILYYSNNDNLLNKAKTRNMIKFGGKSIYKYKICYVYLLIE